MPATAHSQDSVSDPDQGHYRIPSTKELLRVKAGPNLGQRDRSVPFKRPFITAVLSMLVFYLCLVGLLAAITAFVLSDKGLQHRAAYVIAALLGASAICWIFAYLMRRKANCPLCKCTPFLDNLALKHQKARKTWPLNYGNSAVLSVLCTQRWRCMYCGTPFDILKNKSKELNSPPAPKKRKSKKRHSSKSLY